MSDELWNQKLTRENIRDFYMSTVVMVYSSCFSITKEATRCENAIIKSYLDIYSKRNNVAGDRVIYEFGDILLANAKNIVALNINISAYPKGQYAIAIENSNETFNGVFDTSTTGIAEIVNGKSSNDKSIFNLQGQRISELQRGLNIVDGKKVFVR